jgi:nucleoside-diphosphate-sugar epimerase
VAGSGTRLEFGALPYRAGELMQARADTSLATSLGWSARHTVEQGLRITIESERRAR